VLRFKIFLCNCLLAFTSFAAADLVIRNGMLYDGTGQAPRALDVSIDKGMIVSVGPELPRGKVTLDAGGKAVAPGFIDVHTHAENIIHHPKAENFLRMGVTTLILGNCGSSKLNLGDFYKQIEEKGFSPNIASLIGHGTVRKQVMGGSFRRPPDAGELAQMQKYI